MQQAHPPQAAPPTRYTAHTRNQRPYGARAITPAPPTQPGPKGGGATGERTTRRQLVEPEPDHTRSQPTHYSARATDQTASTTTCQRTPSVDRTEYSTQNTDYSHMPRRDTNDHNSPSDRGRGRAQDAYSLSPTPTVYSAQREEPQHTHAATQWHTDHDGRHNRAPTAKGNWRAESTSTTRPGTGPHPVTTH